MHKPDNEGPSSTLTPLKQRFFGEVADTLPYDKIVISGGGMAAVFTAYEILKKAEQAGRKIDVLLLAERFSAPCTAGTHAVLELEGMYEDNIANRPQLNNMLRDGLDALENTILDEGIQCRFRRGYEIKAQGPQVLSEFVDGAIERQMYRREEININSGEQVFKLPGHDHSVSVGSIGQLNTPELVDGLFERIQQMGATVIEGARYEGQEVDEHGIYIVKTNVGDFKTYSKPFLATGAQHQQKLPGFDKIKTEVVHTMGLVLGPLAPEDAVKISSGPMAMCNTDINGDVLWGGIDSKRVLTLGRGDLVNPTNEDVTELFESISKQVESYWPGITEKYPPNVSYGPMLVAENRMPIVGRMKDFDVAGGWAGIGIVAGYSAAQAYADWVVNGNDEKLKLFESMQPGFFQPEPSFNFMPVITAPRPDDAVA